MREFLPLLVLLPIFGVALVSALVAFKLEKVIGHKDRIASVAIVLGPTLVTCYTIYMVFYLSLR